MSGWHEDLSWECKMENEASKRKPTFTSNTAVVYGSQHKCAICRGKFPKLYLISVSYYLCAKCYGVCDYESTAKLTVNLATPAILPSNRIDCEICNKPHIEHDNYTTTTNFIVCFDCWCTLGRDFELNPPKPYSWMD